MCTAGAFWQRLRDSAPHQGLTGTIKSIKQSRACHRAPLCSPGIASAELLLEYPRVIRVVGQQAIQTQMLRIHRSTRCRQRQAAYTVRVLTRPTRQLALPRLDTRHRWEVDADVHHTDSFRMYKRKTALTMPGSLDRASRQQGSKIYYSHQ